MFADCMVPVLAVDVPDLATTRRVEETGLAARAVFVVVPLRAVVKLDGYAERGVTRRVLVLFPVAARAVAADAEVALRALLLDDADVLAGVALRDTTFLVEVLLLVFLVLVRTFIGAFDCEGVVPGFRLVRIELFI